MSRAIVFALLASITALAHAQGSCKGAITGTMGLSVPTESGRVTIAPASVPYVYDAAECQCGSDTASDHDIAAEIRLETALPLNTAGTVEVWVGQGCDDYAKRTTAGSTACEKVPVSPPVTQFTGAGGGLIEIPLPPKAMFAPVTHDCSRARSANNVYVIAYTDATAPFATCELDLDQATAPPSSAEQLMAQRDADGSVALSWVLPPQSASSPAGFQVLCTPAGSQATPQLFSTCDNGVLHRRQLATANSTTATGNAPLVGCSESLGPTTTSTRIGPFDVATQVQVASYDAYGNYALTPALTVAPRTLPPTQPGAAHGCSLAGDDATPPLGWMIAVALALVWRLGRRRVTIS